MIRRLALPATAIVLAILLALLAFFQYRWLGQVSEAERQRMHTTLENRARDFALDFDRELGRAVTAFWAPAADLEANPAAALAAGWARWQAAGGHSRLVKAVFLVDRGSAELPLRRFDPATGTVRPAEWPDAFRAARARWAARARAVGSAPAAIIASRVDVDDLADVPALVVPSPPVVRVQLPTNATVKTEVARVEGAGAGARSPHTILWLDIDEIRRTLLPALVARYFAPNDVFDYQVSVQLRRDPKTVLFESGTSRKPAPAASSSPDRAPSADATMPMFRLRLGEFLAPGLLAGLDGGVGQPSAPPAPSGNRIYVREQVEAGAPAMPSASGIQAPERLEGGGYAISVMRLQAAKQGPGVGGTFIAVSDGSGGWLLRLVHRAGSLDAAVGRLRRRNLAVSSGILGLLAVSLAFVLASTRRAQRLAAQQVEFVASVSHELRTPLAVIRSAGENLADGVVDEPGQIRRYGSLVAEEGRKLGAMVEQVMEFAGMQSDEPRWSKAAVDLGSVVDDAVAGARRLAHGDRASIEVVVDPAVPAVFADRAALVRAVQNLVENALKYGTADGCEPWVGVAARLTGGAGARQACIEVSDRGPGVDAAERRRIFEPFVRGRAASAARVAGNGLGLSIVRRIAEGHGGRVEVRAAPGGGATFTIRIPGLGVGDQGSGIRG